MGGGSAGLRDAGRDHGPIHPCWHGPAFSGYAPCQQARANKDGLAAVHAVYSKRVRYPPHGGDLVPLAWEDGGRPAEETVAYVRTWGYGLPLGERSEVIRFAWQQLSILLQTGSAEMILTSWGC